MLEAAKELRKQQQSPSKSSPLRKRFWQSVHVTETPHGYQVMLDKRPVRTPTKEVITIPLSKPSLAHAVAIEWDMLNSAQEALKNHKIPTTSIVSRAHDIMDADTASGPDNEVRKNVLNTMMRYLDTDTLLCWAPEDNSTSAAYERENRPDPSRKSLRNLQMETAKPIIAFMTNHVWPGVSIVPTLNPDSIIPITQSEVTKAIISGWIFALPAYELAGLERAVLATKSLLIGARLVVAWSEQFRHLQQGQDHDTPEATSETRFDIEAAARAASLEVTWQTGMWGEVEDTHDVEKEDMRRQLGSAVLMVSGHGP
jgi:chaperone required for assembly of F1-ATPase